jgi:hypothetical protein
MVCSEVLLLDDPCQGTLFIAIFSPKEKKKVL